MSRLDAQVKFNKFNISLHTLSDSYLAFEKRIKEAGYDAMLYSSKYYLENVWMAIYVFFIERKRIIKMPFYKKVLYSLTWPTFDIIGRYTHYIALFKKTTDIGQSNITLKTNKLC